MGYTPEQHAAVDAELEVMWTRLIDLAVEIDRLNPQANHNLKSYMYACQAADAIRDMRDALETEQGYQRVGEKIRRWLGNRW